MTRLEKLFLVLFIDFSCGALLSALGINVIRMNMQAWAITIMWALIAAVFVALPGPKDE